MHLDLHRCDSALLDLPDRVVGALLRTSAGLEASDLMLVGARCRDILHSALGYDATLPLTSDLDIGLVLADLADYDAIVRPLDATGSTGIRYLVDGIPTDLMPFGDVEDPVGAVAPSSRAEPMSVWAFREVFDGSLVLPLPSGPVIRLPTVEGYAALKLAAWLDRSAYGDYKDARDLATCAHWYAQSDAIETVLFETESGIETLVRYDMDVRLAAAHTLGSALARQIGPERVAELVGRWPGTSFDDLLVEFRVDPATGVWPNDLSDRKAILVALESGWRDASRD